METFGKFMTVVFTVIFVAIINGFVFSKLWTWFIVSTFQVQPLRVVEAIGIIFLINFTFSKRDKEVDSDKFWENFVSSVAFIILTAGFALLFGWILKMFF